MTLHAMKALVALFVTWMVLRHFSTADFVVWSVTASILVVATASDLGIGQYVVTQLINADRSAWPAHVAEGLGALLPLSVMAAVFVCLAINGPGPIYTAVMAIFLATRILTIPFAAVLNAVNQFKVRKAVELCAYLLAAAGVSIVIWSGASIYVALTVLNGTFLAGALITVAAAARYFPMKAISLPPVARSARVFREAIPFMVNNLTGLLTYGGFIWLSSLALPQAEVAKLALLHSFVLVNLYQIYDVFLKSRQADLADLARLAPYRKLNMIAMFVLPPTFVLAGREMLALVSRRVEIGLIDAVLFGVFIALEMGNLFVQSLAQVNLGQVQRLKTYSVIRFSMVAAFIVAGLLPVSGESRMAALLACLSLGSLLAFVYLRPRRSRPSGLPPTPVQT